MRVVIVGCGRVGADLALKLADEGHDVVVVDKNPEAFRLLGPAFNGLTVAGTGIDQDLLKRAETGKAEAFAAVTNDDNVNIMAAQVAREIFGVSRVVARTNDPAREEVFHEFGITTVCPTDLGVSALKSMLLREGLQARYTLGAGEVVVAEITVTGQAGELPLGKLEIPGKIKVCAVVSGGKAKVPEPETTCRNGDVLVISARIDAFESFAELIAERRNGEPARGH